jgi:hypothetical protein
MKTLKERSHLVEVAITEIRKVDPITDELISSTCEKYGLREDRVRKIAAGFKKLEVKKLPDLSAG